MEFLAGEIQVWQRESLLGQDEAERILSIYEVKKRSFAQALLCAGSLLVGLGVICAVAANWDAIPRAARMGMIVAAYLVSLFASWRCGAAYRRTSRALLLLAGLCFGGGIFLTAQMYHQGGHWSTAFGWWAAGLMPTVWLFRDLWQILLTQGLAFCYLGGLWLLVWYDASVKTFWRWQVFPALTVLALWALWLRARKPMSALHLNILLSLGFLCSRLEDCLAVSEILLLLYVLGLTLLAVSRGERDAELPAALSDWGTAMCGLTGIALSVPEVWAGFSWAGALGFAVSGSRLAAGAAVFTALGMAFRLYRGSGMGGLFLALLAIRYFVDHFFGFLSKAAGFSALGALCLIAGFVWERGRRKANRGRGRGGER